jgi:hypothetical protein
MIAFLIAAAMAAPASAQLEQHYSVDTAADLVALCSVEPGDETYVAAINFCHGYGHGAVQYHLIQAAAMPELRVFCVPDPAPTRAEVRRGFLSWIETNPDYLTVEALDALFTYLGRTYPCP